MDIGVFSFRMTFVGSPISPSRLEDSAHMISAASLLHGPQSVHTASEESFRQLELWIRDCSEGHSNCRHDKRSNLPPRVIDVGSLAESSVVRLCDTRSLPVQTDYLTLSYCWGLNSFLKLRTTNYSILTEEIPFDQLPQTFREAIIVTRRIG